MTQCTKYVSSFFLSASFLQNKIYNEKYISALAEAQDITLYMNPLKKPLSQVEDIDFSECKPFLAPLMHIICMIYGRSPYYCHSSKITVLLRQICNMLINQVSTTNQNMANSI